MDLWPPEPEDEPFLRSVCGLHFISVQDILSSTTHFPKADAFGDYLSLTLHGINYHSDSALVETAELMLFVKDGLVVSSHQTELANVNEIARLAEEDGSPMSRGSAFLTYALADSLMEHLLPTLEQMSQFADEIEEAAVRTPRQETLDGIIKLKRSASSLSRVLTVQRDMLNRISREESGYLAPARVFFRDVYDRVLAIEDLTVSLRERAQDAMST